MRLALAAVLLVVVWLGALGVRPLYKTDESRYAEIPREMVASGDWLTPRLNDFKYFEKPPLQYWATAAFFEVFGERDWAARLWTALSALAGIGLVYAFARRVYGAPAGALAAAILVASPLYVLLGQINTLDMGVTFFLSAAIFAFALERMYWFWIACALAVLSKGLIGIVLPAGAIGVYILAKWDWALLKRMKLFTGGLLFLAIAAPWFIAVSLANAEFFHFFFIQEHFQRFTTRIHGRYQPMWYFLPILAAGIAPWLLLLVPALRRSLPMKRDGQFDTPLFLAIWAVLVFAFFSVSSSKLPSYILPVFPPLAVLAGGWLAGVQPRRLLAAQGLLVALIAAAGSMLAPRYGAAYSSFMPWLSGALAVLAAGALAAAFLAWRGRTQSSVLALAAGTFVCCQIALAGHATLAPRFSVASLVERAGPIPADAAIYAVDAYDHTIPWYLRRTVTMVQYKDELDKAIEWEPRKFVPDEAAFAAAWKEQPSAYAFIPLRDYDRLSRELPMAEIGRDPRFVLVRKK
jgi:4-amino-4-deoxy-L-arabinose transferase-like glycosyltransferase